VEDGRDLHGKVAVVTGASGALGQEISLALHVAQDHGDLGRANSRQAPSRQGRNPGACCQGTRL
jgi:NAD(P)-dependent dehydrogenase (short-subunit alcohol dehydrogenase family)